MAMLEITQGDSPLVLGMPHTGTEVPAEVYASLNENGRALADTDWHVEQLYQDLLPDVSIVRTRIHRYAIDVNRDPAGASLYPGQNTTELCPTTDFEGNPIYQPGCEPDQAGIEQRRINYHAPYHQALQDALQRVHAQHGFVILFDCHSIRSRLPYLFAGTLPDFNIGTNNTSTCDPEIEAIVVRQCQAAASDPVRAYSHVLNGRFKGGWTTRHYGKPAQGYHVVQLELAQASYLTEHPPWTYLPAKAGQLRLHLQGILSNLLHWRPA